MSLLSRLAVQAARAYGILSSRSNNVSADYLVVAGGGGGGGIITNGSGGGGGAGGYLTSSFTLSTLNTYSITVGAGGTASVSGSNSVISGTGLTTVTSTGGGAGAEVSGNSAAIGGSGGGGGGQTGGTSAGAAGTSGQGNAGGNGGLVSTNRGGGGGGGASAVGANQNGGTGQAGAGGAGSASSISGSSVTYAGGGGGGGNSGGAGGAGGGANGASAGTSPALSGTANTGGGGGGGDQTSATRYGGAGGSGIVIISYTSATPKFVGGTITTSAGKQIHTFTSSGTLSPITPITASYLVVAGGGGGGFDQGGGGGAGGLQASSTTLYSGATYIVTIGGGGAGSTTTQGTSGSNTTVTGTGLTTLTSVGGGGGGGDPSRAGLNGGSGGGTCGAPASLTGGTGTAGQGNNGGTSSASPSAGSGGGGAGAAGSANSGYFGGAGGVGSTSSISGTSTYYAGGGGGGANGTGGSTGGAGGNGGGGAGASGSGATPGTSNTGGGGGGGYGLTTPNRYGAAGGSGIVIISYAGSQVFNGGLVTTSGGNTIHTFTSTGALTPLTNNLNNSLRFRSSASAYLSRTPTLAGNRNTWTFSAWVKKTPLASGVQAMIAAGVSTTVYDDFCFENDQIRFVFNNGTYDVKTTQVFRDPSAWYHIVVAMDTTQATAANRTKIYVNGNQVTAFATANYPAQNHNTNINNTILNTIGNLYNGSFSSYFDGYMTDINFIDGQALEPYYFGNNDANGVWKPIQYKGTYGTNGFYLTFGNTTSTTTLGYDSSPNGNNWTCNNISLTAGTTYDAMTDVPTNTSATVANYCTLNPLTFAGTVSEANLRAASAGTDYKILGTLGVSSGKWYWEFIANNAPGGDVYGVANLLTPTSPTDTTSLSVAGTFARVNTGTQWYENGTLLSKSISTVSAGGIIQFALDVDNLKIWVGINGTWQASGDPAAGTNPISSNLTSGQTWFPYLQFRSATSNITANFGQRPFSYTPPTGFVALNTYNLPTPTILQGNKYMDASLYTGQGVVQTVVNAGLFKPDFVWQKPRNEVASHRLVDSVRGVNNVLYSNQTAAESAETNTLTSFNSNGFTGGGSNAVTSGNTAVAWQWQAGQGSTSSNTSGSITSTVSVNTTAGFSIVTYTGTGAAATVGHGLGVAPKMVITKKRSSAGDEWVIWHTSLTSGTYILLFTTAAQFSSTQYTAVPSATVLNLNTATAVNNSGSTYVSYCWAEIAGFSKFGSYTGNGSTDGPFVYTGFRPKFLMFKTTTIIGHWVIVDTSRNTYNVIDNSIYPDTAGSEINTITDVDFLSNGFKWRGVLANETNVNGEVYIYAAFAENPFKNANAR